MKILILFLFCASAFANFVKKSEFESGDIKRIFTKKLKCGNDCLRIPKGYNKEFHILVDEMVDDLDKKIYSKTEIETCLNQEDCEQKNLEKACLNENDKILMAEDFSEIYCSRFLRFEKKPTGFKKVIEDPALKAVFNSKEIKKNQKKAAIRLALNAQRCGSKVIALTSVLLRGKKLKKGERKAYIKTFKDIIDQLKVGSLDNARDAISEVIIDDIITSDDKAALISELDACK